MNREQPCITVIHEGEEFFVPVEQKEDAPEGIFTLDLVFLQSLFSSATALVTEKDNKSLAMLTKNGKIEIHDLKLVYKTRFNKGMHL